MKANDCVKFIKVLSDNPDDWFLNKSSFDRVKTFLGRDAEVTHVQKHFEDNGAISYFLDVIFSCGYELKSVNALCFEVVSETG